MSEKPSKQAISGAATPTPNKMRLYATWVDRTPSNCIPRLCSLTLTRLVILRPLGTDLASVSIAVKMQSSKRTLRSNELILPHNGLLDTPLDVTFCLQYPHFLKREGNRLHILLQRRKRYKNRTMLGFKTLAEGVIRMDQVLQKPMDMELELLSETNGKDKCQSGPTARLTIIQCSSTPVDQQDQITKQFDRDHDFILSDDDDECCSSNEEENVDLSDSEPIRNSSSKLPHNTRHNLKQRFVSLLRRFRVADSEGGRAADLSNPSDIQALFQELESLSCDEDSGNEQDTMSITSTPKPSLRPFFSSSKSLLLENQQSLPHYNVDNIIEVPQQQQQQQQQRFDEKTYSGGGSDGNNATDLYYNTDQEGQSDPQTTGSPPREQMPSSIFSTKIKQTADSEFSNLMQEFNERKSKLFRSAALATKKKNSLSVSSDVPVPETARKSFLEQINTLLPLEENVFPDIVVLIMASDLQSISLRYRQFHPLSAIEVKAVLNAIFNKIHKYGNICAKPGAFVKLLVIGGDTLIGWVIRPYVELLSSKPSDWLNYLRLYIVPVGNCGIAKQLSNLDSGYASLFPLEQELKSDEFLMRIERYLNGTSSAPIAQLPIGEAMLTCQDDSSQLFIPFVNEVRVGPADNTLSMSVDLEDLMCATGATGGAASSGPITTQPPSLTPPSSPNVQTRESPWEPIELQLDYWQLFQTKFFDTKTDNKIKQQDGKTSMKGLFRGLQASPTYNSGLNLTIHFANKEKKQKIMRLGKKKEKEKEMEPRSQNVDGISRLICSARASHNAPMRVYIDGVEFNGVKFFQLSSTWQTHVKNLPVALVGVPLASIESN